MSYGPSSTLGLAYVGVNATTPPNVFTSDRAPGPGDWRNQIVGNLWIDNIHDNAYILTSLAGNQALWIQIAASTGDLSTLTGNSGGAVSPTAANINVVGDGTTVNVVGNPATSTLTISAMGTVSTSFVTDSGTAVPIADVLHVNGDPNITTTGATNVVHVDLNQAVVVTSYSTATPTPIASSLLVSGNSIQAAGTGSNVDVDIASKGTGVVSLTGANTTILVGNTDIDITTVAGIGDISISGANTNILLTQTNVSLVATMGTALLIGNDVALQPVNRGAGTSTIIQDMTAQKIDTTDATVTTIVSSSLGLGSLRSVEFTIQATSITTGTDSLFAKVWANAAYYTGAGSAVLVGTPVIDINTTNLSATVTAIVTANTLEIQVQGIVAETWRWTAQGVATITTI